MNTALLREIVHRNFSRPDEVRTFEKGKVEILHLNDGVVARATLQPGWKWSQHVKPVVGTQWCQSSHFQYVISGRMHIKMADGTEFEVGPGDVSFVPSDHDAWVVGSEPMVVMDWHGFEEYSRR
jgi:mannose-6-phosphate isomerase-like protein (cupin superfamily)